MNISEFLESKETSLQQVQTKLLWEDTPQSGLDGLILDTTSSMPSPNPSPFKDFNNRGKFFTRPISMLPSLEGNQSGMK